MGDGGREGLEEERTEVRGEERKKMELLEWRRKESRPKKEESVC